MLANDATACLYAPCIAANSAALTPQNLAAKRTTACVGVLASGGKGGACSVPSGGEGGGGEGGGGRGGGGLGGVAVVCAPDITISVATRSAPHGMAARRVTSDRSARSAWTWWSRNFTTGNWMETEVKASLVATAGCSKWYGYFLVLNRLVLALPSPLLPSLFVLGKRARAMPTGYGQLLVASLIVAAGVLDQAAAGAQHRDSLAAAGDEHADRKRQLPLFTAANSKDGNNAEKAALRRRPRRGEGGAGGAGGSSKREKLTKAQKKLNKEGGKAKRGGILDAVFKQMDDDRDGFISAREVLAWARQNGVSEEYALEFVEEMSAKVGGDQEGRVGLRRDDFADGLTRFDVVFDRGGASSAELDGGFDAPVFAEAWRRAQWCVGLMLLQSASSTVLQRYELLLKAQPVVATYLTTLLGVAGSAGSQSAVKAIRGLRELGTESSDALGFAVHALPHQMSVGILLAIPVSIACFARVLVQQCIGRGAGVGGMMMPFSSFHRAYVEARTIATVSFALCVAGALLGTILPAVHLVLRQAPSNGATSLPVLLDIAGVALTCVICSRALVSSLSTSLSSVDGVAGLASPVSGPFK